MMKFVKFNYDSELYLIDSTFWKQFQKFGKSLSEFNKEENKFRTF